MQPSPIPQTWSQLIYLLTGILIGLIPEIYRTYRDRKKSYLEASEAEARIEKTTAEVTSLRLHDDLATGEGVGRMLTTLIEAGDQLRDLQRRATQAEADAQMAQMFVDQLNAAGRLAVCEHHPNGVRLSDYAPQQLKKPKHS
jgi:hypothetical protein